MNCLNSNKEKYFSFLLQIVIFGLSGLLSFIIIHYFHFGFDFSQVLFFIEEYTRITFLSILVIFLFQLPITLFVGNVSMGALVTVIGSSFIGFVNYQKMLYRPEPLYPSDVSMLKDIKFLLLSIETKDRVIAVCILFFLVLFLFFYGKKVYKGRKLTKKKLTFQLLAFLVSLSFLYPVLTFGKSNNIVKKSFESFGNTHWITFNQVENYNRNGVVAGLLFNMSSQVIDRPVNYSKEEVKRIAEHYHTIARFENRSRVGSLEDVNVVYVMNESFADPFMFEGWTISPDPLPNYREIIKDASSGQMLSQGFGGGTANIEFEALTGISMEPMLPNISIAYTQLTKKMVHVPSILSYFNQMEKVTHKKTAIHPFQSSMYKRPEVYRNLGFDNVLFDEDMDFTTKLESSLYISDDAAYDQVFKEMSETKEKDFIHLVTMQGHGPYYVGYFGNLQGFEIEGPVKKMDMLNYLSSLSYSDDYLKEYIDTIETMEEKVITVFWGDHLPSAFSYGITSKNPPIQKFLTPVFIHSNYETEKNDLGIMSPIYYANEILDMTNSKLTGYYAMLGELRKYLPAFEKEYHIFNDIGNIGAERVYSFDQDATQILNDYDMLLYDIFEGNHYFEEFGFFEITE